MKISYLQNNFVEEVKKIIYVLIIGSVISSELRVFTGVILAAISIFCKLSFWFLTKDIL